MRRKLSAVPFACALFVATTTACGGASTEAVGVSHPALPQRPVELALRTPDGQFLDIGDLRGAPTIIFVFATFDALSQAAIHPVSRFHRAHPEAHVVGLAAQPEGESLLAPYAEALHIQFTVAYDPDNTVARGLSGLGPIEAVPMFIAIDQNGVIADEHIGYASERQLERMLMIAQGLPVPTGPPPEDLPEETATSE